MISICIPVYNYDIAPLLSAIEKQIATLDCNMEILVCDDASTTFIVLPDNSKAILSKNDNNIGRNATRLKLAQQAQYKYLLFLDADVMLGSNHFIENYVEAIKSDPSIIYGGVTYKQEAPELNYRLRWNYGNKREAKSLAERTHNAPHDIISMGFGIKKEVFLNLASQLIGSYYGQDIHFSYLIKSNDITVDHIDNPVIHLGLETNAIYLKKSIAAIQSTVKLENDNLIDTDIRPVQKAYIKLKKYKSLNLVIHLIARLESYLIKKLKSGIAPILYLDLIKLLTYAKLKNQ